MSLLHLIQSVAAIKTTELPVQTQFLTPVSKNLRIGLSFFSSCRLTCRGAWHIVLRHYKIIITPTPCCDFVARCSLESWWFFFYHLLFWHSASECSKVYAVTFLVSSSNRNEQRQKRLSRNGLDSVSECHSFLLWWLWLSLLAFHTSPPRLHDLSLENIRTCTWQATVTSWLDKQCLLRIRARAKMIVEGGMCNIPWLLSSVILGLYHMNLTI